MQKPAGFNAPLLDQIKSLLIDFANREGISLADHFGDPADFRQFVISFTIKQITALGVDLRDAYDIVMGDGSFDALANDVWETLNEQQPAATA